MEFVGYDRSINPRRIELFKRAAAEHLVEPADGPILEEWYGWRPMTYDELPCIGRAPKVRNVIVAAGHGMIGISTDDGHRKTRRRIGVECRCRILTRRPIRRADSRGKLRCRFEGPRLNLLQQFLHDGFWSRM